MQEVGVRVIVVEKTPDEQDTALALYPLTVTPEKDEAAVHEQQYIVELTVATTYPVLQVSADKVTVVLKTKPVHEATPADVGVN
jgi:hypothetical protein